MATLIAYLVFGGLVFWSFEHEGAPSESEGATATHPRVCRPPIGWNCNEEDSGKAGENERPGNGSSGGADVVDLCELRQRLRDLLTGKHMPRCACKGISCNLP